MSSKFSTKHCKHKISDVSAIPAYSNNTLAIMSSNQVYGRCLYPNIRCILCTRKVTFTGLANGGTRLVADKRFRTNVDAYLIGYIDMLSEMRFCQSHG